MSLNDNFKSEFDLFSSMVDIDNKKEHLVSSNGRLFLSQSKKPVDDFISYLKIRFSDYDSLLVLLNTNGDFYKLVGNNSRGSKIIGQFSRVGNHVSMNGFDFKSDYMNDLLDNFSASNFKHFNFEIHESCLGYQYVSGFVGQGLNINLKDTTKNTSEISPKIIDNNILDFNGDVVTYIIPFVFGRDYQQKVTFTQSSVTVLNQKIIDSVFDYVSTLEVDIFGTHANKKAVFDLRNYDFMIETMFHQSYNSSVHLTYVNGQVEIAVYSTLIIAGTTFMEFIQPFCHHYDTLQKPLFRIFNKGLKKLMLNYDDMDQHSLETKEDFENYFLIQEMKRI